GENSVANPVTDKDVGISKSNQSEFPGLQNMQITGAFSFGSPTNLSKDRMNVLSFADTVSFSFNARGRHETRAGTETRREQDNLDVQNQRVGLMTFASFPDFLIGRAAGAIASGGNGTTFSNVNSVRTTTGISYRAFRNLDQSLFLADDWKVSPKLTLNLGLRY